MVNKYDSIASGNILRAEREKHNYSYRQVTYMLIDVSQNADPHISTPGHLHNIETGAVSLSVQSLVELTYIYAMSTDAVIFPEKYHPIQQVIASTQFRNSVYLHKYTGLQIRLARKKKRLSQEALAQMAGCSKYHISRVETGKVAPSLQLLVVLANILEVTLDELLLKFVPNVANSNDDIMKII